MKKTIITSALLFLICYCQAQETFTGKYVGFSYGLTKNESFINKTIRFVSFDNDTLLINLKLPIDTTHNIIDMGIYYNCHLQRDTIYTITLKKICVNEIPDVCNSYYFTNTVFDDVDCTKFTEIEKNTPYEYKCGYSKGYGKFVDIKGLLYEIVELKPDKDCFCPH